jgi:large subunit ribosomal protein L31
MRQGIHPNYVIAHVRCSCGNEFTTRATKPEIRVELCNQCPPFYTGKQKLVDSGGRVERYKQRYAKTQAKQAQAAKVEAKRKQKAGSGKR